MSPKDVLDALAENRMYKRSDALRDLNKLQTKKNRTINKAVTAGVVGLGTGYLASKASSALTKKIDARLYFLENKLHKTEAEETELKKLQSKKFAIKATAGAVGFAGGAALGHVGYNKYDNYVKRHNRNLYMNTVD